VVKRCICRAPQFDAGDLRGIHFHGGHRGRPGGEQGKAVIPRRADAQALPYPSLANNERIPPARQWH
jgi:hypothetical protein